jgi:hypothetical protein
LFTKTGPEHVTFAKGEAYGPFMGQDDKMATMPFALSQRGRGRVFLFVALVLLSVLALAKTISAEEDIPVSELKVPQIEERLQVMRATSNQLINFRALYYGIC